MPRDGKDRPLRGLKVIEMAGLGPAPMCAMLLAALFEANGSGQGQVVDAALVATAWLPCRRHSRLAGGGYVAG
ncbi:MAG: hypothetical protein EOO24_46170 [Comamonadaceae bacterium]|nr:MAG: hypothetical protein EOO24_46170 [Comamonadaceae bacterium]